MKSMDESTEILQDPDMMSQILESEESINRGETEEFIY